MEMDVPSPIANDGISGKALARLEHGRILRAMRPEVAGGDKDAASNGSAHAGDGPVEEIPIHMVE